MIFLFVTLFVWLPEMAVSHKNFDQRTNIEPPVFAWVYRLVLNSLGYLVIFLPLLILRAYLSQSDRMDRMLSSKLLCLPACVRTCFVSDVVQDSGLPLPVTSGASLRQLVNVRMVAWFNRAQSLLGLNVEAGMRTASQHYTLLAFCVIGLQFSYVLWGIMQVSTCFVLLLFIFWLSVRSTCDRDVGVHSLPYIHEVSCFWVIMIRRNVQKVYPTIIRPPAF
ncbi:hypothetical protein PHET_10397 [Paragonimus heterotremus]|uniref:Uncharacterized protein n=1 Tax=Paragonimus heterotremus TaxID=100268 RepID=A0A8J4WTQ2_9TREM|nr:hypothetical protein PHET_10397 [Paragonimus heterotremus]